MGLSLIPQAHGGALLSGGKPGNPGHNQHTARQRAAAVRAGLVTELEGAAKDDYLPPTVQLIRSNVISKPCTPLGPGPST